MANSFAPRAMRRFGLEYADVAGANPAIIYLSMPLAGASGPYRDYLGYGMSIAALVGIYGLSGLPGRLPVGTGTNYPDHMPNPLHARSEEHTSELQSLLRISYAVFCLKKKKQKQ